MDRRYTEQELNYEYGTYEMKFKDAAAGNVNCDMYC